MAARNGLVVKSGAALENVSKVDIVVFDKTGRYYHPFSTRRIYNDSFLGTLTMGTPSVAGVSLAPTATLYEMDLLKLAASVERFSSHILAKAIVNYTQSRNIPNIPPEFVTELQQIEGSGIEAKVFVPFQSDYVYIFSFFPARYLMARETLGL